MTVEPDKREAYLSRQTDRWTLTVGSLNPQSPANFTENSASVAFRPGFLRVVARRGSLPPRPVCAPSSPRQAPLPDWCKFRALITQRAPRWFHPLVPSFIDRAPLIFHIQSAPTPKVTASK